MSNKPTHSGKHKSAQAGNRKIVQSGNRYPKAPGDLIFWFKYDTNQSLKDESDIVRRARDKFRKIYERIAKTTGINDPEIGPIVQAIVADIRAAKAVDQLKALELLYEAGNVIAGKKYTIKRQNRAKNLSVQLVNQQGVLELLRNLIRDSDVKVRRAAAKALSPFVTGWPGWVCAIAAEVGVNNEDSGTAFSAMCLIDDAGRNVHCCVVPALCRAALSHKDAEVRNQACRMVGRHGAESQPALQTLVHVAANDDSDAVRRAAVRALLALFQLSVVCNELTKAVPELSTLIADLAGGSEEFQKLREELQQPPAETGNTSQELVADADNGPQPPNKFVWGEKCAELSPRPWDLVKFVWDAHFHSAKIDDVIITVWGHGERCKPSTFKSAISRANNSLLEKGIPINLYQTHGQVAISIGKS